MKQLITYIMIAALLSGCGVKRDLVLPGHEKHKADQSGTGADNNATPQENNSGQGKPRLPPPGSMSDPGSANPNTVIIK